MAVMKSLVLPIGSPVVSTPSRKPLPVITPDKPTTAPLTTLKDEYFGQVKRTLAAGATGPVVFTLFLRLLSKTFDRTDTGASYTELHHLGVPNWTPFCDFSRTFRGVVSAATGTERVLAPGDRGCFKGG